MDSATMRSFAGAQMFSQPIQPIELPIESPT